MIKQIPEHPSYGVSDSGHVYSITPSGLVELKKDISNGYPRVKLDGQKIYVSNLVANQFLKPPKSENLKLFYIDGDKNNCAIDNLTWLSQSEIKRYSQYTVEYRRQFLGEWT